MHYHVIRFDHNMRTGQPTDPVGIGIAADYRQVDSDGGAAVSKEWNVNRTLRWLREGLADYAQSNSANDEAGMAQAADLIYRCAEEIDNHLISGGKLPLAWDPEWRDESSKADEHIPGPEQKGHAVR